MSASPSLSQAHLLPPDADADRDEHRDSSGGYRQSPRITIDHRRSGATLSCGFPMSRRRSAPLDSRQGRNSEIFFSNPALCLAGAARARPAVISSPGGQPGGRAHVPFLSAPVLPPMAQTGGVALTPSCGGAALSSNPASNAWSRQVTVANPVGSLESNARCASGLISGVSLSIPASSLRALGAGRAIAGVFFSST